MFVSFPQTSLRVFSKQVCKFSTNLFAVLHRKRIEGLHNHFAHFEKPSEQPYIVVYPKVPPRGYAFLAALYKSKLRQILYSPVLLVARKTRAFLQIGNC